METIIFEFLLGVLAGTIFGLLIVKHSGNKPLTRKASSVRTRLSIHNATSKPGTRKTRLTRRRKEVIEEKLQSETTENNLPTNEHLASIQSCPTCGLEAPENLMAEHFIGSPSHKYKPVKPQPITTESEPVNGPASPSDAEDSRDSVRNLLQMLVPPRAFGRRHMQRTVDPLSSLVHTDGSSRRSSAQ